VTRGDKVMVIDPTTNTLVDSIPVGDAGNLGRVATDSVTGRVFVPGQSNGQYWLFVVSDFTVTDSVQIADLGQGVAYNPSLDRVYVTLYGQASVQVIDPTALAVVDSLPAGSAGGGPNDVAVNPVTNRFYVTIANEQSVWVYDASTDTLITTVFVGPYPDGIDVDVVRNRIYVARFVFAGPAGYVVVIDGSNNQVLQFIEPGFTSSDVAVHQADGTVSAARQAAAMLLYFYTPPPPGGGGAPPARTSTLPASPPRPGAP